MAFLPWHDRYRVGHPAVDQQHRKLFELVNHFDDVIKMGMEGELRLILDDLIASTEAHFAFEEALLEQMRFPGAAAHQKIHGELLHQVAAMQARLTSGGHGSMKSVVRFLADWLTNHVLREDLDYVPYLKSLKP